MSFSFFSGSFQFLKSYGVVELLFISWVLAFIHCNLDGSCLILIITELNFLNLELVVHKPSWVVLIASYVTHLLMYGDLVAVL